MAIEDDVKELTARVKSLETALADRTEEIARLNSALTGAQDEISTANARLKEIETAPAVSQELPEDVLLTSDKFYRWWKDVAYAYYSAREPSA